ncbi:hypothetical protein SAMN05421877_1142 [Sphingobacterium lactis]|uniref:Uncharacterized protein n=1 Tax=Sphingobacterium lactis TaxID=797291 RepID=A0A1H6C9Y3_9SPHI|nr:hypothetical protein SAMN05421877_1142 [Sphingobacterium lactis]
MRIYAVRRYFGRELARSARQFPPKISPLFQGHNAGARVVRRAIAMALLCLNHASAPPCHTRWRKSCAEGHCSGSLVPQTCASPPLSHPLAQELCGGPSAVALLCLNHASAPPCYTRWRKSCAEEQVQWLSCASIIRQHTFYNPNPFNNLI